MTFLRGPAFAALVILCGLHAPAQPAGAGAPPAAASAAAAGASAPLVEGTVRKIDRKTGRLTLQHGRIPNLDMPGMTMAFPVADPKALGALKAGDEVRFSAERVNGAVTVTRVEKAAK